MKTAKIYTVVAFIEGVKINAHMDKCVVETLAVVLTEKKQNIEQNKGGN